MPSPSGLTLAANTYDMTATWTPVAWSSPLTYTVELSAQSNFATIIDTWPSNFPSVLITGLSPQTNYFVRVYAADGNGNRFRL